MTDAGFGKCLEIGISVLSGGFLSGGVSAGGFVDAGSALVFLADLFDQTAGHQVLKLFIGPQAEHFLAATYRVAQLEVREYTLEQVVETEYFLLGKNTAELISDMVRKAA